MRSPFSVLHRIADKDTVVSTEEVFSRPNRSNNRTVLPVAFANDQHFPMEKKAACAPCMMTIFADEAYQHGRKWNVECALVTLLGILNICNLCRGQIVF